MYATNTYKNLLKFQLIFLTTAIGICSAARLENTYLPPTGAGGAGGGPGLATPFGPRPGGGGNGKTILSIK